MTLRELIERLEREDRAKVVRHGFARPHSYRGFYDQLAFTPAENVTVGSMLGYARSAVGATYHGWKGGEYTMDLDTPVWIAEPGDTSHDDDHGDGYGSLLPHALERRLGYGPDALVDTALAPLDGRAIVVEKPSIFRPGGTPISVVPFQPGRAEEWLPAAMRAALPIDATEPGPLFLHLGISDERTAPYLRGASDSVPLTMLKSLMREMGYPACFAGNWHERRSWGGVLQVGALVPTGWDNPGFKGYGTLAFWTGTDVAFEEIPGPRFLDLPPKATPARAAIARAAKDGHVPFCRVKAEGAEGLEAARVVASVLGDRVIVEPDAEADRAGAADAAKQARSAETLQEALAAYVGEMPLAEGVNRARVLERARGYLGGGA